MNYANEDDLKRALDPACKIIGHYQGALEWLALDDFINAIMMEGPAEVGTVPLWELVAVDITGDAACVKVVDHYLGMQFTDYLALLKTGQGWKIVNKLYYLHT
jgi:hypothetical protein